MALICDTGAVYALYDAHDVHHAAAKNTVEAEAGPLFAHCQGQLNAVVAAEEAPKLARHKGFGQAAIDRAVE